MSVTSYEIAKNLFLVQEAFSPPATAPAPAAVNHIAVIDCSGSMAGDLPRIREQLKRQLPKLLAEGDTFSLIWFSGRGEFGVMLEAEPVATLKDLAEVNKAIDRWLKPIGLTGFKEPLGEVAALVKRVGKKNGNPFALFFMTDGCDNQWNRTQIMDALAVIKGHSISTTFVEYGYYADRALLAAMAEQSGGSLIFAESFDKYEPVFEQKLQQRMTGTKCTFKIQGDPIGGFAWAPQAGGTAASPEDCDLYTFQLVDGKVTTPGEIQSVWYLSPTKVGDGDALSRYIRADRFGRIEPYDSEPVSEAYAALSLFATRMKPDIVYPILKALGDVELIDLFAGCFGKQKYTEFQQRAKYATFDPNARWVNGYDPTKVPADDAFTVLDLLHMLAEDERVRLLLDHPAFEYSRISRKRVDADENFYVAEQEKLDELKAQLAKAKKPADVKKIQAEIDTLVANKQDALKFVADAAPNGYPLTGLVYNEDRANISMRVLKTGTVDLTDRLMAMETPPPKPFAFSARFQTQIWRNYSIVVDGLVNVKTLPVVMSRSTFATLKARNVKMRLIGDGTGDLGLNTAIIDVASLPIINRNMVGDCSAAALIEAQYELTEAKAYQKVYNAVVKEEWPEVKLAGFTEKYGADAAAWLKEQGITESGFSPKTAQAESTDYYVAKALEVKLKGMSALPKVDDARAGKGGACGRLMKAAIDDVDEYLKNDRAKELITLRQKSIVQLTRNAIEKMAQAKFTIIVGQVWPKEFPSVDENTLTVKIDDKDIVGSIVMSEVQVNI